jgi:heteromeric Ino2p/Ino4p transcription factor
LTELVPGLEGQGRSEGIVLSKTVEYVKEQIEERKRLVKELDERGVAVDERDRL